MHLLNVSFYEWLWPNAVEWVGTAYVYSKQSTHDYNIL